jgi:hypothetical protein
MRLRITIPASAITTAATQPSKKAFILPSFDWTHAIYTTGLAASKLVAAIAVQAEHLASRLLRCNDPERMQVLQVFCKPNERIGGLA